MGLMLSVLVCCVGVIELITFYHNITRHFTDPPQRGDLSTVSDRYIHELGGIRKRIAEDLQKYQEQSQSTPTLRLNSHEDIEIEYSEELQRSRSPSPRRFLVTEKEDPQGESNSPRKFLISEEPNGLKRSKSQDSIPEFLIHEEQNTEKSSHKPRYILKEKQTEESPLPLPRQFIVSEETLNTVVFEDTDFEVPASSVFHDKSPSPFLTVEPPHVPRNSICNELDREEEEEEALKAIPPHQSQKVDVILENTSHNTTQYWTNKVLVVPSGTSSSRSRSISPDRSTSSDTRENIDNSTKYDEKYLNNLDGVSKAKSIKRFGSSRKSVKRKTVDHNQNSQNCLDQNSLDSVDTLDTTAVLTHAAEELKKVSSEEEEIGTSKTSDGKNPQPKPGEPFWVKNL
uniref:Uncharacterized protein LOC114341754 n=1 Tax=Diabrotica virgifera virgifera TaxID=50390 RepID=A0A6P7GST8_DIAVI